MDALSALSKGELLGPEQRLVVVNMSSWPEDFTQYRMYCCPATDGGFDSRYRHYPAKHLAPYWSGGCRAIALVAACVRLGKDQPDEVIWKFSDISDEEAIAQARRMRADTRRNPTPCLVFVLTELRRTEFMRDAAGGMQGPREFFDVSKWNSETSKTLADSLNGKPWSMVDKWRPS